MKQVQSGDIVQLDIDDSWANGLLMIVEEVRAWGFTGYVPIPRGHAPMRAKFDNVKRVWRPVPDA